MISTTDILSLTHFHQGHSVSIRACYRNVDQGFSESGSLAFFWSTMGVEKSIIRAKALVLGVNMLALLTWLALTTSASQVDMVGVKARHRER